MSSNVVFHGEISGIEEETTSPATPPRPGFINPGGERRLPPAQKKSASEILPVPSASVAKNTITTQAIVGEFKNSARVWFVSLPAFSLQNELPFFFFF